MAPTGFSSNKKKKKITLWKTWLKMIFQRTVVHNRLKFWMTAKPSPPNIDFPFFLLLNSFLRQIKPYVSSETLASSDWKRRTRAKRVPSTQFPRAELASPNRTGKVGFWRFCSVPSLSPAFAN